MDFGHGGHENGEEGRRKGCRKYGVQMRQKVANKPLLSMLLITLFHAYLSPSHWLIQAILATSHWSIYRQNSN